MTPIHVAAFRFRRKLLSVLYEKRRNNPRSPSVGFDCLAEECAFIVDNEGVNNNGVESELNWNASYLDESGYIKLRTDSKKVGHIFMSAMITSKGIDFVEEIS